MVGKVKAFMSSDQKWTIIKNKIIILTQRVVYGLQFGHFGKGSMLIKPIRIVGKKCIDIGNNVVVLNGARMEAVTSWKDKKYDASIVIEDNVSIGQNFHVVSAANFVVGKNTTISGNVFITNANHEYRDIGVHVLHQELIVKETKIGENCFIGYGASIQAGTVLGKQCIVGTNAVVRGVYGDYCVLVGAPARVVKRYNVDTGIWERVDS